MAKFRIGEKVIYDRGEIAEIAGVTRYVEATVTMVFDRQCWIEWNAGSGSKVRKQTAQVPHSRLRPQAAELRKP